MVMGSASLHGDRVVAPARTALTIHHAKLARSYTALSLCRHRRDDAGDERCRAQPQPGPDLAAALGGAHVRRKRDGFGQQLRFRQVMQRQLDGAAAISATDVSPSHSRQTLVANSFKQLAALRRRS